MEVVEQESPACLFATSTSGPEGGGSSIVRYVGCNLTIFLFFCYDLVLVSFCMNLQRYSSQKV